MASARCNFRAEATLCRLTSLVAQEFRRRQVNDQPFFSERRGAECSSDNGDSPLHRDGQDEEQMLDVDEFVLTWGLIALSLWRSERSSVRIDWSTERILGRMMEVTSRGRG